MNIRFRFILYVLLLLIFLCVSAFGEIIQSTSLLFEPYPRSTILSGGADSVTLSVQSRIPTVCRYSLGENLPYDNMRSFDSVSSTTVHTAEIKGLNPNPDVVNYIYIKCADKPEEFLCLGYSSLPKEIPDRARVSAFTPKDLTGFTDARIKSIGLWVVNDSFSLSDILRIRNVNPSALILLNSFVCTASDGLPDDYYLKDVNGGRIEAFTGNYRLNISDLRVCDFVLNNIYNKFISLNLPYDGYLINELNTKANKIAMDKNGTIHEIDTNKDGQAEKVEDFEKAWRSGLVYLLRNWKWYTPYAPIIAHTTFSPEDTELFRILNGKSIIYYNSDLTDNVYFFETILDEYDKWMSRILARKVVLIEDIAEENISEYNAKTLSDYNDFISSNYPAFRLGYAMALMNDGYFTQRASKLSGDIPMIWHDEYDFALGKPASKAKFYFLTKNKDTSDIPVTNRTSILDTVAKASSKVLRRDFENGIALANGEAFPVKIVLEKSFRRLSGANAPLEQIIVDNEDSERFKILGPSSEKDISAGGKAAGFAFGSKYDVIRQGDTANWNILVPRDGKYSLDIWYPSVPDTVIPAKKEGLVYYDLLLNDEIINVKRLDMYKSENSLVEMFKNIELKKGDLLSLRAYSEDPFVADAIILNSEERFNNGEIVTDFVLNSMDGIILENIE